ncbi:peroxide stress protein YaaA [Oceanospirillum linum]|uniref:UPF0246 protein BTA35_0205185 n=1 Tax=Oceanospirillum linum TaxID=966 RepID=A0A1T1HGI9_OCELI|nr:peroxide stress protein YaaA [Oceanospirillum linum]OOV88860.1 hypothetical protein BTA35_0205185 [Oceanospirillum linum]SEG50160.1 hypothetical protein SAMN04489856_11352 [Oleiphilus messinensis]SMP23017.1 hypothetical protein SAMN06264348_104314 [Oceanospirillum linum]
MKLVISPAKTLDFESAPVTDIHSQPEYLEQSQQLIDQLKVLSQAEVASLMKLSDKLAALNVARFGSWETPFTAANAKQAILAFKGDVYTGLNAENFSEKDFKFAQNHLRILSGLYGLLKPLDLIQPYRLEMGTKFANNSGKNLYEFWGMQLTDALNNEFSEDPNPVLINLASNEYFKAVKAKQLNAETITPVFKDWKNGQYKMISFYAKKARGLMAAYVITKQLTEPEQIKAFNVDGYYFSEEQSKGNEWVFLRDHDE